MKSKIKYFFAILLAFIFIFAMVGCTPQDNPDGDVLLSMIGEWTAVGEYVNGNYTSYKENDGHVARTITITADDSMTLRQTQQNADFSLYGNLILNKDNSYKFIFSSSTMHSYSSNESPDLTISLIQPTFSAATYTYSKGKIKVEFNHTTINKVILVFEKN